MKSLEIITNAKKIATEIRDYSKSQKKLWQKIPLLALEANGRTGFNNNYSKAYYGGFWDLDTSINKGYYSIYVDLASGELIDSYLAKDKFFPNNKILKNPILKPARKEDILKLAFNLEELDAKKIISMLEQEAKQPYLEYYNPQNQEAWRDKIRMQLNLSEFYQR